MTGSSMSPLMAPSPVKMTERYGTSIAKLLPQIMISDSWTIKAEILARSKGGKIYNFEADSKELKDVMADVGRGGGRDAIGENDQQQASKIGLSPPLLYDSTT